MQIFHESSINLNNSWVIVKKHNGNTFFKRPNYVNSIKNNPHASCIYTNFERAQEEVKRLNENKKRNFFYLEKASVYFVNNWQIYSTWSDTELLINRPVSIYSLKKEKDSLKICSDPKQVLTAHFQYKAEYYKSRIKDFENSIVDFKKYVNDYNSKIEKFDHSILNGIEEFSVDGDKIVKVLFGEKS